MDGITFGEMIDVVVGVIGCTRPQAAYMLKSMKTAYEAGYEKGRNSF